MQHGVETSLGRIAGEERDGVVAFRGIPFARAPVGERRFQAPAPAQPWAGVRDATRFGASAPQLGLRLPLLDLGLGSQDEDCLFLNVTVPATPSRRRPVLVWIHGGAFVIGSGSQPIYDGRTLALRGDAVVVTVNYRLGALGYLDLGTCGGDSIGATANAGLLDQVAALRWVQENAVVFGGDPDNVTVFGESAGGMSVATLLGTPGAEGLFRRAIPQSGACQALHDRESAGQVAHAFLDELGLPPGDLAKLREVPLRQLLAAQGRVLARPARRARLLTFQPVVDAATLPRHPLDAVRDGAARGISLLVGTTRDEWHLFALMDARLANLDESGLVARVERRAPGADARRIVETYRAARAGHAPVDPRALFLAIETDRVFRIPAVRLAEAHPEREATFMYRFDWESPFLDGRLGACHAIELPFVFGTLDLPVLDRMVGAGPEARRLAERTMDAWLAFARAGAPVHADLGAWPAYRPGGRATMRLGRDCGLERDPQGAERRIWEDLL